MHSYILRKRVFYFSGWKKIVVSNLFPLEMLHWTEQPFDNIFSLVAIFLRSNQLRSDSLAVVLCVQTFDIFVRAFKSLSLWSNTAADKEDDDDEIKSQ